MIQKSVALTAFYLTLNELVRTIPDGVCDRELARIGTAFVRRDNVGALRFPLQLGMGNSTSDL